MTEKYPKFMNNFREKIEVTSIFAGNTRYIEGLMRHYGRKVLVHIWLTENHTLKVGDKVFVTFNGDTTGGSFEATL